MSEEELVENEPEPLTPEESALLEGKELEEKEPEEKEIEEKPEEAKPEEVPVPEKTAEERSVEAMQKRIDTVTYKHKLLKENPEEYYQKYPDEKPPEKAKPDGLDVQAQNDISGLVVTGTGTEIDGMTLKEAYDVNPALAAQLQYNYYRDQERQKAEESEKLTKYQQEAERETREFADTLATQLFGKKSTEITPEQDISVREEISKVLDWMQKTRRGGGNLADAHFLMNKDRELGRAAASGADAIAKALSEGSGRSVSLGADPGKVTGFERYLEMSEDQMAEEVEKMGRNGGQAWKVFKTKAPQAIRKKFPDLFD